MANVCEVGEICIVPADASNDLIFGSAQTNMPLDDD